ncbi:MAG: hypothetical protein LQ347_005285 [Umbilicaria vellea]|nr:MAG: hypothetical protein LQ347_005285 [Umbilicaria vellea]
MPDFSDSRKGRRSSTVDDLFAFLLSQCESPMTKDFEQLGYARIRDPDTSKQSSSTPAVVLTSSAESACRRNLLSSMDDERAGGSDIERPEFVKDYLVKRGFDPSKPLPRKAECALRTEVACRHVIRRNPDFPPWLLCHEQKAMPGLIFDVPFCMYFTETDSIHVPNAISHRGAYDIPMSGDWEKWVVPYKDFWTERENELEMLRTTGKLVKRNVDRWGRPWGSVHAGLGKQPRIWGKREEVCVFSLNSGGSKKTTEPYWREGKPGWVSGFHLDKFVPVGEDRLPQWLEIDLRSWLKVEHK